MQCNQCMKCHFHTDLAAWNWMRWSNYRVITKVINFDLRLSGLRDFWLAGHGTLICVSTFFLNFTSTNYFQWKRLTKVHSTSMCCQCQNFSKLLHVKFHFWFHDHFKLLVCHCLTFVETGKHYFNIIMFSHVDVLFNLSDYIK